MTAEKHYDIIRSPVITEKSTQAGEYNQVMFNVAPQGHQA
jgi:large subunit ribosomal protein L23